MSRRRRRSAASAAIDGRLRDAGGETQLDRRGEAVRDRIQRGRPHAVIGRDADDLDGIDIAIVQPLGKRHAIALTLKAR